MERGKNRMGATLGRARSLLKGVLVTVVLLLQVRGAEAQSYLPGWNPHTTVKPDREESQWWTTYEYYVGQQLKGACKGASELAWVGADLGYGAVEDFVRKQTFGLAHLPPLPREWQSSLTKGYDEATDYGNASWSTKAQVSTQIGRAVFVDGATFGTIPLAKGVYSDAAGETTNAAGQAFPGFAMSVTSLGGVKGIAPKSFSVGAPTWSGVSSGRSARTTVVLDALDNGVADIPRPATLPDAVVSLSPTGPPSSVEVLSPARAFEIKTNAQVVEQAGRLVQRYAQRLWKENLKGANHQLVTGKPRPVGTKLHTRTRQLLERYIRMCGDENPNLRSLEFEVTYLNTEESYYSTKGAPRYDVYDPSTNKIYDFCFGDTKKSESHLEWQRSHAPRPDEVSTEVYYLPYRSCIK